MNRLIHKSVTMISLMLVAGAIPSQAAFLLASVEHPTEPVFQFQIFDTANPSTPVLTLSGNVPNELEGLTHAYDNVYYGLVSQNNVAQSPVYRFVIDTYNWSFTANSYSPVTFHGETDSAVYIDKGGVKQLYSIDNMSKQLRSVVFSADEMAIVDHRAHGLSLRSQGVRGKIEGMTYDAVNHKLYFTERLVGDTRLYAIDGIAGSSDMDASTLTYIGSLGYRDVEALEFGADGRLYATSEFHDLMFEVDPFTGMATPLGSIGGADIEGLAKFTANIPEPASVLAFLAVVLTGMTLTRGRE